MTDFMKDVRETQGLVDIEVGGQTYTITLMPARASVKLALDVAKIFFKPLGAAYDSKNAEDFIMPDESTMWTEIARYLTQSLDNVDLPEVMGILLEGVTSNGKKVNVDMEFRGEISGLILLTEKAMKENWADFFTVYLKEKGIDLSSLGQLMEKKEQTPDDLKELGDQ